MEEGTWTDHGAVITSQTGDVYNASMTGLPYLFCVKADGDATVDPNLIDVNGALYLGFGSYWDCIFQVPMSDVDTPASVS